MLFFPRQIQRRAIVASADHGHAMTSSHQRARKFIRTRAAAAIRRIEVLVEIKDAHG